MNRVSLQTKRLLSTYFYAIAPLSLLLVACDSSNAQTFLPVKEAFQVSAHAINKKTIEITYQVAPKYYLYQERLSFVNTQTNTSYEKIAYPKAIAHYDENFQKTLNIYRDTVKIQIPVSNQPSQIKLGYQGCADAGLCYPPQQVTLSIDWNTVK